MKDEHFLLEMMAKYESIPLLTKEEERHLLENKNDPAAQKKLVDANMRYLLKHIRRYKGQADMPTLVEEGKKGLIKAIENYDYEKNGLKFLSYAMMWIRQAAIKYMHENHYFTDPRDRKMYKTVKIGEQVWMAQNLAYNAEGSKYYDDDEKKYEKYGRLYDWDTAMKSCPDGWHLPSREEWQTLIDFAGGTKVAGKKLGAIGEWIYDEEKEKNTDDFGFAALPGGWSYPEVSYYMGGRAFWHSSSTFPNSDMVYSASLTFGNFFVCGGIKNALYSIRCIKNVNEPEAFKTAQLCLEAVKKNGYALKYVPEEFKTAELCLEAIKQNGNVLEYVPENLKTEELCYEAVKKDSRPLEYVPENLKTTELCLKAIRDKHGPISCLADKVLKYVPEHLKTPELCLEAVKMNGYGLQYVPEALKTVELCFEAVKRNGDVLEYVPEALKTEQLYLEAIKRSYNFSFKKTPEAFKTAELCLEAAKRFHYTGFSLEYVPEALKTAELCLEAVKRSHSGFELHYVPENLKTVELCIEAVKQAPRGVLKRVLQYVPKAIREEVKNATEKK